MWPNNNSAAAGYRDPTTLFDESRSATSASSSSADSGSEDDYHTLQTLFSAAPGFIAAGDQASSQRNRKNFFQLRGPHHRKHSPSNELTAQERQAQEQRRRQLQDKQERRFFKERGALDFQRSVVFRVEGEGGKRDGQGGWAFAEKGQAEGNVFPSSFGTPFASPAPPDFTAENVEQTVKKQNESTPPQPCVPVELQAWYVASNTAPSSITPRRTRPSPPPPPPQQQQQLNAQKQRSKKHVHHKTEDEAAALTRTGAEEEREGDSVFASARAAATTPGALAAAGSKGGAATADLPVQSSGAGTTSVNMLWSRAAPSAELRHALRGRASGTTQSADPRAAAAAAGSSSSKRRAEDVPKPSSPSEAPKKTDETAKKKNSRKEKADGRVFPSSSNPFQSADVPNAATSTLPPSSIGGGVGSAIPAITDASTSSTDHSDKVKNAERMDALQKARTPFLSDSNSQTTCTSSITSPGVNGRNSEIGAHDDDVEDTAESMNAFVPVDGNAAALSFDFADGGRPPLRAHRYVEQPNGVYLDHAQHADLLAQYAMEEQLRYAQAREDARRARRWNRLLHGRSASQRPGDADHGDTLRADGTNNTSNHNTFGGGRLSGSARSGAATRTRYHWLYDAATFRHKYVAVLRYLQRVHVCLVAVAAGMNLLTLIAITLPFSSILPGQAEDGLPSDTAAVVLLALMNTSATSTLISTNNNNDPSAVLSKAATAQVLPVLQQGRSASALVLALLQPYHATLLLCIGVLLFITGFSPISWGVAERYWMAQRRAWLRQDDEQQQRRLVGFNAWPSRLDPRFRHTTDNASGSSHHKHYDASPYANSLPGYYNNGYYSSDGDDAAAAAATYRDAGDFSGSATAMYNTMLRSPATRGQRGGPPTPLSHPPRHASAGGGSSTSSAVGIAGGEFVKSSGAGNYYAADPSRAARYSVAPPYSYQQQQQQRHRRNSSPAAFPGNGYADPRLARSISVVGGAAAMFGRRGMREYDALRNSVSLGATRNATAGFVGGADNMMLGASFSGRAMRSSNHHNNTYNDYDYEYSGTHTYTMNGLNMTDFAGASVNDLPSTSALSFTNNGGARAGAGGDRGWLPAHNAMTNGTGTVLSGTGTLLGGGWSPSASSNDVPRTAALYCGGAGASSTSSRHDGAGRYIGPAGYAETQHPRSARYAGALPRHPSLLPPPPPPILLFPLTALEGSLSANNVFSRTFDYIQRRATQWICNVVMRLRRCEACAKRDEDGKPSTRTNTAVPMPTSDGFPAAPVVPISLYLHLLLQPRLWCIVVALALTVVEVAFVDERSVELMWLAEPQSWWSPSSVSSSSNAGRTSVSALLPHTWLNATFSQGSVGVSADAEGVVFGGLMESKVRDRSGRVAQVLLAVYATRTAVTWVSLLLNLFF